MVEGVRDSRRPPATLSGMVPRTDRTPQGVTWYGTSPSAPEYMRGVSRRILPGPGATLAWGVHGPEMSNGRYDRGEVLAGIGVE